MSNKSIRILVQRAWLPPVVLLTPLLWLFRRGLFAGETFAFRDAAHYYYPLYSYVHERWKNGLPLWNPLEGIGQPLLADPTAAVLYPGKLIFLFPIPYQLSFVLYVVLHLWIGGYGAYWCARCLRSRFHGALIASIAYELGGHVLFQYCNPIFCVGAAWLPWGLFFFERAVSKSPRVHGLLLAIVLSLMILGGAPQTAYHCVLVAALRICTLFIARHQESHRVWRRGIVTLGVASAFAVLLSAVQVLPSYEWANHSDRAIRDAPRSIWEWSEQAIRRNEFSSMHGMWRRPAPTDEHLREVYNFSVGPWRWSELFWPNINGEPYPVHARWTEFFPGSGRLWTPSLYLGLLPIMLALVRIRPFSGPTRVRWMSWMTFLAVGAALGEYGLGWLANEFNFAIDRVDHGKPSVLPGLGGLYWMMTVCLPSYISFRYPAKWWTVAALGISLLAAKGWPIVRSVARWPTFKRPAVLAICCLILSLFAAAIAVPSNKVPVNPIFGPFDALLSRQQILCSILHTMLIGTLLWCVVRSRATQQRMFWLVTITVVELAVVQGPLVVTLPASEWKLLSPSPGESTVYRCEPQRAYPPAWLDKGTINRFSELQRCDLGTLMPKHHLSVGVRSLRSSMSMMTADYHAIWQVCPRNKDGFCDPPLNLLGALGADTLIAPRKEYPLNESREVGDAMANVVFHRNEQKLPRAWLVNRWEQLPSLVRPDRTSLLQRTRDVLTGESDTRNFRQLAIIEQDEELPAASAEISKTSVCKVVVDTPELLRLRAETDVPAVLVVRDQYYPGWQAYVSKSGEGVRREQVLRVNRVMQGLYLSPGAHTIEFRYEPVMVYCGAVLSAVSWMALMMYAGFCFIRGRLARR